MIGVPEVISNHRRVLRLVEKGEESMQRTYGKNAVAVGVLKPCNAFIHVFALVVLLHGYYNMYSERAQRVIHPGCCSGCRVERDGRSQMGFDDPLLARPDEAMLSDTRHSLEAG